MLISHSPQLDPVAQVRGLIQLGVPKEKAEAQVYGPPRSTRAALPPIEFPIVLTVPWSCLVSDNEKFAVGIRHRAGGPTAHLLLRQRYRDGGAAIRARAHEVMSVDNRPRPALSVPLHMHVRVFVPDNRTHDVVNFAKGVHDALEGVIYENDSLLHRVLWERAGVDVDRPRAEIEVRPL